jgi:hypothetical protein
MLARRSPLKKRRRRERLPAEARRMEGGGWMNDKYKRVILTGANPP